MMAPLHFWNAHTSSHKLVGVSMCDLYCRKTLHVCNFEVYGLFTCYHVLDYACFPSQSVASDGSKDIDDTRQKTQDEDMERYISTEDFRAARPSPAAGRLWSGAAFRWARRKHRKEEKEILHPWEMYVHSSFTAKASPEKKVIQKLLICIMHWSQWPWSLSAVSAMYSMDIFVLIHAVAIRMRICLCDGMTSEELQTECLVGMSVYYRRKFAMETLYVRTINNIGHGTPWSRDDPAKYTSSHACWQTTLQL